MAAINTEYKEPSYGNWRVPRSAGLGNLGAIGTGIVMVGLLLGIISFAIWGLFAGPGRPGRRRGLRPAADGQGQARPVRRGPFRDPDELPALQVLRDEPLPFRPPRA